MKPEEITAKITSFLHEIGIETIEKELPEDTFLPGIRLEYGALAYDPTRLKYPGDLLHEAGHIAVMTPSLRAECFADAGADQGEEIAAQAWSYAAAVACGIEPELVFHDSGYQGGGTHMAGIYRDGYSPGAPLLAWFGLTGMPDMEAPGDPKFPAMKAWVRKVDDPSTPSG
ncbi:MAG: hypothetical protein HWE08_04145 [Alphaproteobacteria bacterium]|nr:hypothetical protein [Alphaproteobacteria bacterium]